MKFFAEDLTATQTANILGINQNTAEDWYDYLRHALLWECMTKADTHMNWEIEADESYFWPKRIRWKRWRWAWWKIKVLWLLKRKWKVYVEIIPDCSAKSILPIIRWKVEKESIMNTDWWKAYDGLIDLWYAKHYRVHHWENEFARWTQHINWIESFWSFTKRRLGKFNGISKHKFELYLKECQRRFNCWLAGKNMYKELMKISRNYSLC